MAHILNELKLKFTNKDKPEDLKLVIIQYKRKNADVNTPKYELGSGYYHKGWWVNFYNPFSFSQDYEVLAWAEYNF